MLASCPVSTVNHNPPDSGIPPDSAQSHPALERRTLRLKRGDSGQAWFVIRFRREVIRDAEALFA
jgi:hypothetical protein